MKINQKLLAASGVQSILNFCQKKLPVDFLCSDLLLGVYEEFSKITLTMRGFFNQQNFLQKWKQFSETPTPEKRFKIVGAKEIDLFSVSNLTLRPQTDKFKFFEQRLNNIKIPHLPRLLGLGPNSTFLEILNESNKLGCELNINFSPHSTKRICKVVGDYPLRLERGLGNEFCIVWTVIDSTVMKQNQIDQLDNISEAFSSGCIHPCLNFISSEKKIEVTVRMNEEFQDPCFDEIDNEANKTTKVIREMLNFANSLPICKKVVLFDCGTPKSISCIKENFFYSEYSGNCLYVSQFNGKEIFKKIIEVSPQETVLFLARSQDPKLVSDILDLVDGDPKIKDLDGVLSLEWEKVQLLEFEGRVFVRRLDYFSIFVFEVTDEDQVNENIKKAKEYLALNTKDSNLAVCNISESQTREDSSNEDAEKKLSPKQLEASSLKSDSSPTARQISSRKPTNFPFTLSSSHELQVDGLSQKRNEAEVKALPQAQESKALKPKSESSSTTRYTQKLVARNFKQKPMGKTQESNSHSSTQSTKTPKPDKTPARKDKKKSRQRNYDKTTKDTKIDMIKISIAGTVCCLVAAVGLYYHADKFMKFQISKRRLSSAKRRK
eukprot:GHVP01015383.1.p1 GENE.GHVP01015383.1~~GHVP01015383.1.p1  ORF type:complete len:606 (+),score=114.33 GHVP01015383.1:34-1851(+)